MAGRNNRPNGKGDQPRKVNGPKYRDNYDGIKWNKNYESKSNRNQARPQRGQDHPKTPQ
jgi:hypothetical protein